MFFGARAIRCERLLEDGLGCFFSVPLLGETLSSARSFFNVEIGIFSIERNYQKKSAVTLHM